MKKKWFSVWKREEYKEWALPTYGGYWLTIIRQEKDSFLCAQAKLVIKPKGLPVFELLKKIRVKSKKQAQEKIKKWQKEFLS